MTKYIYITLVSLALCMLTACNPEANAVSGDHVKIDIYTNVVSSGYMQVTFRPNADAYYHVGIVPIDQAPDTSSAISVKNFMQQQLDRTYADYLNWRPLLLEEGVSTIAEFATHSLQYGSDKYYFTFLVPDNEYMIYAYAVDAKTNKPDGKFASLFIRTERTSMFEDLQFEYRVRGYWDYVYPAYQLTDDAAPEVLTWVPWAGASVDSATLAESDYTNPKEYFMDLFDEYTLYKQNNYIHFGIDVRNNNYYTPGTSETIFEEGHTYYTGLSLMDGYLSDSTLYIYRFRWENEQTQLYLTAKDALTTEW